MKHSFFRRVLFVVCATFAVLLNAGAQTVTPQATPRLDFVLQLKVTLGEAYTVGQTPHGRRMVIPITGGTFEGPQLKGTILNGGADY